MVVMCLFSEHARPLFTLDKVIKRFWWANLVVMINSRLCDQTNEHTDTHFLQRTDGSSMKKQKCDDEGDHDIGVLDLNAF